MRKLLIGGLIGWYGHEYISNHAEELTIKLRGIIARLERENENLKTKMKFDKIIEDQEESERQ